MGVQLEFQSRDIIGQEFPTMPHHIMPIIQYMGLCVFSSLISLVVIERIYILSYNHHQIGRMNYYPLFRVRSWNNGMRCMSLCILMQTGLWVTPVDMLLVPCKLRHQRQWRGILYSNNGRVPNNLRHSQQAHMIYTHAVHPFSGRLGPISLPLFSS